MHTLARTPQRQNRLLSGFSALLHTLGARMQQYIQAQLVRTPSYIELGEHCAHTIHAPRGGRIEVLQQGIWLAVNDAKRYAGDDCFVRAGECLEVPRHSRLVLQAHFPAALAHACGASRQAVLVFRPY